MTGQCKKSICTIFPKWSETEHASETGCGWEYRVHDDKSKFASDLGGVRRGHESNYLMSEKSSLAAAWGLPSLSRATSIEGLPQGKTLLVLCNV